MTEPDVTLTDYGLAVGTAIFAWLIHRGSDPQQPLGRWFVLFFSATSVAALVGGTVHGFFLDPSTAGARILWPVALIAVGGAALAAWGIGAHVQFSANTAGWICRAATLEFAAYAGLVIFVAQTFAVAVLNYLPAAIFLLFVFLLASLRRRDWVILLGAAGMLLTFVAAGAQQAGVGLHSRYLTHNALFHLIQGISLSLIFASARHLVGRRPC